VTSSAFGSAYNKKGSPFFLGVIPLLQLSGPPRPVEEQTLILWGGRIHTTAVPANAEAQARGVPGHAAARAEPDAEEDQGVVDGDQDRNPERPDERFQR